MRHSFGSDNHSGVHPSIMDALCKSNKAFAIGYGDDDYSMEVLSSIEKLFGGNCSALFVLNGTGANVLALSALTNSTDAIICAKTAHINVDECGAPEKNTGAKIIPIDHIDGKISPELILPYMTGFGFQHHSQPKVISISQSTELGTVYTLQELKNLANFAHSFNCYLHIDGTRLANAAASLNVSLKEIRETGVDALSFGGTKNGLMIGEVVVFFDNVCSERTKYIRKQICQLYSKGRYIAAQYEAYLKDGLYLTLADHSNKMAKYLQKRLKDIPEISITRPVETNAVFAIIPKKLYEIVSKKHFFYIWEESTMEVRWMCSFNTTEKDIDDFIEDIYESTSKTNF